MGTVSVFSIEGLDIYFNSSDHYPPHFHAESAHWEIRVYIDTSSTDKGLDFDYKRPKQPSKRFHGITKKQRRQLLEMVINHRVELLEECQEKVNIREII